jgi:RNA polymerase sigma factor (TIGR02999 family)
MGSSITDLLQRWDENSPEALEALLPLVYDQLKVMASRRIQGENGREALQPTELVHEVYLRLAATRHPAFRDRAHFYGVVAALMRRILVDLGRKRNARKRGALAVHVQLDETRVTEESGLDFEALDRALERLAAQDAQQARIVELRYFGGLSIQETAAQLGVSNATVKRDWVVAKAWLLRELRK